jgi:predicted neuraminidase
MSFTKLQIHMSPVICLFGVSMLTPGLDSFAQIPGQPENDIVITREFIYEKAPFPSAHASTIVETSPGKMVAAWFGGTQEGSNDVEIWSSRKEEGKPWSEPVRLTNTREMPAWNPVLFQIGNRTFLYYKVGPGPQQWVGAWKASDDGGKSWTRETYMPAGLLGPIRAKPIQLSDGTWLAGTSVEAGYRWDSPADAPYRTWTCWVERSTDKGERWVRYGPIAIPGEPFGVIQPTLWQTVSGEVRMLMRSTERVGRIVGASSSDGGKTWSPAKPTELPNPNAGIDVVKLRGGRLVLIYNHATAGRDSIHLAVSRDDGNSWSAPMVLEKGQGEFSYPAVIQAADGTIHVTYTWRRARIRHLVINALKLPK